MATFGLVFSVLFLAFVAWKGLDLFTSTILASLIVILTSGIYWYEGLTSGYVTSFSGFVTSWLFVMILGALFGQLMNDSGCAESVALKIVNVLGTDKLLLSIGLICMLFTFIGISGFVVMFITVPICEVMMRKANVPRRLIPGITIFGTVPACGLLPYSVDVTNIIPTQTLGTTLGAAPMLGIVAGLIVFILGYFYMKSEIKKAALNGETYLSNNTATKIIPNRENLPNYKIGLIPLITLIVLIISLSQILDSTPAVIISLSIACIVTLIISYNYMDNRLSSVRTGMERGINSLCTTAAVIGFSGVIRMVPEFSTLIDSILTIDINPYIKEYVGINIISGLAGSSTAGVTIFMETLGQSFVNLGLSPEVIHRLAPISAAGLNTLPHSMAVCLTLGYMKLSHRESYKYMFVTSVIIPLIAGLVCTIMAIIFY